MRTVLLCVVSTVVLAGCASMHMTHVPAIHTEYVVGRYVTVGGHHHLIACGDRGGLYDVDNPQVFDALVGPGREEPFVAAGGTVETRRSTFDHAMRPAITVASAIALPDAPMGCQITPTPAMSAVAPAPTGGG
ncbi:hypothetical protein DWG18_13755 [Lysobacter sp. TY2-98]|uniref:hypothetical protein n=1 Tax=Lysobacter sp. TY2-98 TaxID=2290922 RepID=UPI000E20C322|nr:hypothetical protein [Lysobacter sp. TY2-98]AXK73239.1 hypothetical protein DWG18_13755 [Lysobacter sp. TY2-98]